MKKFLAIFMSAILLLGLLAGCGNKEPIATTEATQPAVTPAAAGMLVLNLNGSVNISYDADGLVLNVEGLDNNGSILAGEYTNYLGKSCSDVICDLIANSKLSGIMFNNYHCVMIKQSLGSVLPGTTFLETILKDAETAVAQAQLDATVVLLTEENLDKYGYINLESAKALMLAALGLDSFNTLDGTISPINGMYAFSITTDSLDSDYTVDAVTGLVMEGQLEGYDYGNELGIEEEDFNIVIPSDDIPVEDTTVPVEDTTVPVEDTTVPVEEEPADEGV